MKKLLRLWVMTRINHTEEYYQGALRSNGCDITTLTHNQIATYKAVIKCNEADLLIEIAFSKDNTTKLSDVDCTVFKPAK